MTVCVSLWHQASDGLALRDACFSRHRQRGCRPSAWAVSLLAQRPPSCPRPRRARPRCCGGRDTMSVSCLGKRLRSGAGGSPAVCGEALQAWAGGDEGGGGARPSAAGRGHGGG